MQQRYLAQLVELGRKLGRDLVQSLVRDRIPAQEVTGTIYHIFHHRRHQMGVSRHLQYFRATNSLPSLDNHISVILVVLEDYLPPQYSVSLATKHYFYTYKHKKIRYHFRLYYM